MWVLRVIFLMVGFSVMLSVIGCKGVQKREDLGFGDLVNAPFESVSEVGFNGSVSVNDIVGGSDSKDVEIGRGVEIDVQVDGQFELFDVVKMLLIQFGYSLTCSSEGKVMVSVVGSYTDDEIVTIAKGICETLGYSLVIDGRICTIVRVDKSRSVPDYVMAFKTKYVLLNKDLLGDIQSTGDLKVLVFKDIVVVYGLKQQVLRIVESLKLMDIDYLRGCFVKFVSCFDAEKVISLISGMYELEGVKVIKVSVDLVVVVTRSSDYMTYISRMIKSLSSYSTMSEVYVYKCSYDRFVVLKKYLVSFDVLSKQVLMRLYMVDVRGTRDSGFGLDWWVDAGSFSLDKTSFGSLMSSGISGVYKVGNVKAFFKMLEKVLDARVINKPSVFVKSGQEAEIKFTRSVPVLTSKGSGQSVGVGTGIIQNIEYKDVGVIFRITPVCVGSNILIEVYVENSLLQKDTGVENNPLFLKDSVRTNFTVRDGSFCVLGGIRYDNNEVSVDGVPFLSRIKYLGYLFGGFKRSNEKREMLVCLYPKVVRDEYEFDRLSESLLEGMRFNQN